MKDYFIDHVTYYASRSLYGALLAYVLDPIYIKLPTLSSLLACFPSLSTMSDTSL